MAQQIQVRRDTSANWTSAATVLAAGEIGFETNTGKFKIGDGSTAWASLTYFDPAGGGGGATNLAYTASPTNGVVTSDTGTDATVSLADGTNAGLMAPAQHTKLAGIETGATADMTAAEILAALLTVDGAGSGLDADLLDGQSSAAFLTAAAAATTYQPLDSDLTAIAALTTTSFGRSLLAAADAAALRTLAAVGTISTQASSSVSITGGSITGITDLAVADGGTGASTAAAARTSLGVIDTLIIPIGDETTAITTGTAKVTFRMPFALTVSAVRASLTTASSSGIPTFDINEGGVSILSTKLTIDASEKTSTTAATAAVISDTALADDAEITIDVDVAGTGAAGAKIYIIGTR